MPMNIATSVKSQVSIADEQSLIEQVRHQDQLLAYIIRAELSPAKTTFLTPSDFKLQVGFVVYPAQGEITRHVHRPIERHLVGTSEVLLVKSGRCLLDTYTDERALVGTSELTTGDIVIMVGGGHGFRMLEDTVLLEIKQGPYSGVEEKIRF
jgi:hypothetical protein